MALERARRSFAVATAALIVASCGAETTAPTGEERVAAALDALRRDFDADRAERVCDRMTARARAQLTGVRDCPSALRQTFSPQARRGGAVRAIERVRIVGDRATVLVALTPEIPGRIDLVKRTGGSWQIDGVGIEPVVSRTTSPVVHKAGDEYRVWDRRTGRSVVCPPLTALRVYGHAAVDGGCVFDVTTRAAPLVMRTPFGDFEVARCRAGYRLHLPDVRQVLVDRVRFSGPGRCRRTARCANGETGLTYPWQGERVVGPAGRELVRVDLCINTPLGRVRGFHLMEVTRDGRDVQGRPLDYPVGESSLQFLGRWDIAPDDRAIGGLRAPADL